MFASVLLAGAVLLVLGAAGTLVVLTRLRRRVRRASWLLTRVCAAIGEAERAWRVRTGPADPP